MSFVKYSITCLFREGEIKLVIKFISKYCLSLYNYDQNLNSFTNIIVCSLTNAQELTLSHVVDEAAACQVLSYPEDLSLSSRVYPSWDSNGILSVIDGPWWI